MTPPSPRFFRPNYGYQNTGGNGFTAEDLLSIPEFDNSQFKPVLNRQQQAIAQMYYRRKLRDQQQGQQQDDPAGEANISGVPEAEAEDPEWLTSSSISDTEEAPVPIPIAGPHGRLLSEHSTASTTFNAEPTTSILLQRSREDIEALTYRRRTAWFYFILMAAATVIITLVGAIIIIQYMKNQIGDEDGETWSKHIDWTSFLSQPRDHHGFYDLSKAKTFKKTDNHLLSKALA